MEKVILVFVAFSSLPLTAQVIVPVHTFISGGTGTTTSGPTITGFSNFGQPLVFPRTAAPEHGGGAMVANNLMYSTSSIDAISPVLGAASLVLTKNTVSNVTMTASDDIGGGVTSAFLYHRPIASGGEFDSTYIPRTSGDAFNGTYTLDVNTIPGEYDDVGMEYYAKVRDSRNLDRSPATGTVYVYTKNPAAQITPSLLSYGNKTKNYRIISIPYNTSSSVAQVFTDLPLADKNKFRLWQYDTELNAWTEYADFNTIDRARGYFIIMNEDQSHINLSMGMRQAEANNRSSLATLYDMTLRPGWNLIGNPYTVPIVWSEVRALNGNPSSVGTELKVWGGTSDAGSYSNLGAGGELAPFQGAFVFLNGTSNITLDIPFKNSTVGGRTEAEEFTSDLSETQWRLPLILRQAGNEYLLGGIGMHPDAKTSYDPYDDFNPPSFSESFEINFPHPEHSLGSFARDMKPTRTEYIWRFIAKTNEREPAELSWNNTGFGSNDIELYLYDVRTNEIINMREEDHYTFSGRSKEFKVYYGQNIRERIGPDAVSVDEPYPNPCSVKEPAKFIIGLPDNLVSTYTVELTIRNHMGIPVHAQKHDLAPGLHTLIWTGPQSNSDMPPAGFYFYTVKVGGQSFTGKILFTNQND